MIDAALASPHDITDYIKICDKLDKDTGAARAAIHTYEEIAYSRGKKT